MGEFHVVACVFVKRIHVSYLSSVLSATKENSVPISGRKGTERAGLRHYSLVFYLLISYINMPGKWVDYSHGIQL